MTDSAPSQPAQSKPIPPPPALDARGLPVGYPFQSDWEVSPREVRDLLAARARGDRDAADLLFIDCRKIEEWNTARIEGSVLIPMAEAAMRLDEIEGESGDRDRPIVVHCHAGKRSLKVTAMLRAADFSNVRSMAGGIDLWSIDVDPGVPRYT